MRPHDHRHGRRTNRSLDGDEEYAVRALVAASRLSYRVIPTEDES
jgi:hypothetical protein